MKSALDSSILVAALVDNEPHHEACLALLSEPNLVIHAHALVETFNTLTGGKLIPRINASIVAAMLEEDVAPCLEIVTLSAADLFTAMRNSQKRGVRGGAIFDYNHLVAASIAGAKRLYTLNVRHFMAFHRPGDPDIVHP